MGALSSITDNQAALAFEPPEEFDDYVIIRPLGEGSMGRVYLAEDAVLSRHVAIKFIADVEPDLQARQRFLMEARAVARIQHPNVVTIYRVGELGDQPYLVTELVRGQLLSAVARPMPAAAALAIALDLARGLAAAHCRGVLHCDIKPDNVMVAEDGGAKLVDFGLARIAHDDGGAAAGVMTGTRDYMAPELWEGRPPSRRSDVYALGALLYELLAGGAPFADVDVAELRRAVAECEPPPLAVERDVAALVARCMARDPERRYAGGDAVREAIEQLHAARSRSVRVDDNPYRGLRPFEAEHRGLFFGRDLEVGAVVERLRTDSVVVIAGDSGVGKSSLVRAGVVPAILDGALGGGRAWRTLTVVPGRRPLTALAAALDDPGLAARMLDDHELLARQLRSRAGTGGIVLFVDQLEELITVGDPAEVAAFDRALACLCEGVAAVRLITTVRADFLARLAALPRFGEELSRVLYFVRALPPERLRAVITGPATATAVAFEPDALIDELVEATAQAGSGGLPLLSFALAELWETRDRERQLITRATLDAVGGVGGALARHGDAVLARMPPDERSHARKALLRLVTSDGTRAPRGEAELTVGARTRAALDALVEGRLLAVRDGEAGAVYELAHEALIKGWGTLRDWLTVDADDRAQRERLSDAAAEWERGGRAADLLWRGPRLAAAVALDPSHLTALERALVAASTRAARRRWWAWRGAAVALVAIVGLAYAAQQHVVGRRLADAVDDEVRAARGELEAGRAADRRQRARAIAAFAGFDAGAADAEDTWREVLADRATAGRAYGSAARRVEAALAKDPTRADVRGLLGDILLERAELADLARDVSARDEMLGRVAAYDPDGARRQRWSRPGRVTVRTGAATEILVDGQPAGVGTTTLALPPGPHVVELRAPGRPPLREPIMVERGDELELELALPGPPPDGFAYVPPGRFLYGSGEEESARLDFFTTSPLHARRTDGFLIGRTEVTIAAWLAFVDAQPEAARADLLPNIPTKLGGGLVIERSAGGYRLTVAVMHQTSSAGWGEPLLHPGRARRAAQDWRRFPVTGIDAEQATRYARWLDATGQVAGARLCTEVEWERAARGPDGRSTPSGRALAPDDANLNVTYDRVHMGLDEVGAHPGSVSPYGLHDTAGNAFEWTLTDRGEYVLRGGSYYHDRKTANLANRNVSVGTLRDATAGLRLCATASSAASTNSTSLTPSLPLGGA